MIATLKTSASRLTRAALGGVLGVGLALSLVAAPAQADEAPASPALWAVTDADSTIYLFGTVHVLRPETAWRTPQVEAALAEADEIWLEIANIDDAAAAMPLMMQYGRSDTPLSSLLSEKENGMLAQAGAAIGMPAPAFEGMQPWSAALIVSVAGLVQAGFDPESGVDRLIKAAADSAGLPVRGLETMEQQIRFFAELPQEVQLQFLRQSLENFEDAPRELDALVAAWAVGDVAELESLMVEEMQAQWGALYEVLLVRRNADWADQIQTLLEGEGVSFIAVGAAHLAGEDSVQAMLAARGVEVARR